MCNLQIHFIDNQRAMYEKAISKYEFPLFDTYRRLSQFTLCDQSTADILTAIQLLQPMQQHRPNDAISSTGGTKQFNGDNLQPITNENFILIQ